MPIKKFHIAKMPTNSDIRNNSTIFFIFNQSFNSSQVIIVKVFGDAKSNHRLSSRYLLR